MLINFIHILEKYFWAFVAIYILYIFYLAYGYFQHKAIAVNIDIYNRFYLKEIMIPIAIIIVSFLFRLLAFKQVAIVIIAVPALFYILKTLIIALAWIIMALLFNLTGKS